MKIGVLGSGNMAQRMARIWIAAGHEVTLSVSRDPAKLASAAKEVGAKWDTAAEATSQADVVVLATTWSGALAALEQAGPLEGKIVWSIITPMTPDSSGLAVGTTTSGCEELARAVPLARFVGAWPPFADALADGPAQFGSESPAAYLCGEDDAKAPVRELLRLLGADPVDAGPLYAARFIEPSMMLLVHLAYGRGMGVVANRLLQSEKKL